MQNLKAKPGSVILFIMLILHLSIFLLTSYKSNELKDLTITSFLYLY